MEEGKYAKMRNLILRNRRWIKRQRKKKETEVLVEAVGRLIEKASKGREEFLGAKELLKSLKKAILSDRVSDLQEIVERDLRTLELEERKRRTTRRFLRLKNLIKDLSEYGEDVSELERIVVKVEEAFERGDIEDAERHMEDIERYESISRLSMKRAENLLRKAKSSIMHAQNLGMEVKDAEELYLMAENLLSKQSFLECMEKAKDAHQIAESSLPEEAIAKRREIEKRINRARLLLDEARKASIDVSDADTSLQDAEKATEEGRLRDAEIAVTKVEELGNELMSSLEGASKELISSVHSYLESRKEAGIPVSHAEQMCSTAEDYYRDGKFQAAFEYAKMAQRLAEKSERSLESEAEQDLATAREEVKQAKALGAPIDDAEALLEKAKVAVDEKDFAKFKALMAKAEGSLAHAEKIFQADRAKGDLEEIQTLVQEAKGGGIGEVVEAEIVVRKAEQAFEEENYEIVSMLAETAKEMLGESKKKQLIQRFAEKSGFVSRLVEKAGEAGVDASEVQEILKSAQESFAESNYEAALKLVEESENISRARIERFLKERYPRILVDLPVGAVQSNIWNKYILEVMNVGDIAAEDVRLNLMGEF
ncbi:MAG: hypothetical protein ACE5KV_09040, partial [Thermoplasmata archaeon]